MTKHEKFSKAIGNPTIGLTDEGLTYNLVIGIGGYLETNISIEYKIPFDEDGAITREAVESIKKEAQETVWSCIFGTKEAAEVISLKLVPDGSAEDAEE